MQYRPYTRFAYAISVIPEGQGGGRSLPWTVSNEACQTCRDDLLVRNPLKILAVQEACRRSLGWMRENIWECVRVSGDSSFRKLANLEEDVDGHFRQHRQLGLLVTSLLFLFLGTFLYFVATRFGGPCAFRTTRFSGLCSGLFIFPVDIGGGKFSFREFSRIH